MSELGRIEVGSRFAVACPKCGSDSGSIEGAEGRQYIVIHEDDDAYDHNNPLRTRGGWAEVGIFTSCCGEHLRLIIAQDKGMVVIGAINGWT